MTRLEELKAALVRARGAQVAELMLDALEQNYPGEAFEPALEETLKANGITYDIALLAPALSRDDAQRLADEALAKVPERRQYETKFETVQEALSAPASAKGQVKGQTERQRRRRPGPVARKDENHKLPERNFFRMSNDLADKLLATMPTPILRAYVYAHRLAALDGTFYVSAGKMAIRIGAKSTRHGERVMARLQESGLVRLLERGSAKARQANLYQLVPLERLDLEKVKATLRRPLAPHREPATTGANTGP